MLKRFMMSTTSFLLILISYISFDVAARGTGLSVYVAGLKRTLTKSKDRHSPVYRGYRGYGRYGGGYYDEDEDDDDDSESGWEEEVSYQLSTFYDVAGSEVFTGVETKVDSLGILGLDCWDDDERTEIDEEDEDDDEAIQRRYCWESTVACVSAKRGLPC